MKHVHFIIPFRVLILEITKCLSNIHIALSTVEIITLRNLINFIHTLKLNLKSNWKHISFCFCNNTAYN